jgi:hypothetical protein
MPKGIVGYDEKPAGCIDVTLACWKENRYGEFRIERTLSAWHVNGEMHTVWDDESQTEQDFSWFTRRLGTVMKWLDREEDTLLKADALRSENEPMQEEEEEEEG